MSTPRITAVSLCIFPSKCDIFSCKNSTQLAPVSNVVTEALLRLATSHQIFSVLPTSSSAPCLNSRPCEVHELWLHFLPPSITSVFLFLFQWRCVKLGSPSVREAANVRSHQRQWSVGARASKGGRLLGPIRAKRCWQASSTRTDRYDRYVTGPVRWRGQRREISQSRVTAPWRPAGQLLMDTLPPSLYQRHVSFCFRPVYFTLYMARIHAECVGLCLWIGSNTNS